MRCCVAAKRGRDDQTEAKYSMRQGNFTIAVPARVTYRPVSPGAAAPAGFVELIEQPGRAIPGPKSPDDAAGSRVPP
jgi:hypothetical protein